ncbi:hypothetical protein HYPSUDRAFT_67343 [Hypholoma sublateritium FD-334 SS-4]|uniref:Uncharacterized protein n=1 Tax=Hypholoma sublateritium (strain FD-334 SS-4) TaxID=945553 RepID=A0A0D2MEL0_HYPSF|nr:hypothetical protein HYPSUDRAFT_67343 [Hypholoma sublateritium FD-334 SS-4]
MYSRTHELPAELWREIFQCSGQFRDPFERRAFLITTLAVCSTWRSIALQTPSLWSTIVLNHTVTRTRTNERLDRQLAGLDLIEHFLKNSGKSTLNIYIQLITSNREKTPTSSSCNLSLSTPGLQEGAKSSVLGLATVLAPHAARFQRFHILSTRFSPVRELLSAFPQVPMPCLEELHIDRVQSPYSQLHFDCPRTCPESLAFLNIDLNTGLATQECFHNCFPVLKSVALSFVPILPPVFTPGHLTTLKMTLPHLELTEELRTLLTANSHCLENLSFMFTHINPFQAREPFGPVSSEQVVLLLSVNKLSLSYVDPDMLLPLISFLRFPGVTNLRIANIEKEASHSTQHLFSALSECLFFKQLEELDLENIFSASVHPHTGPSTHFSPGPSVSPRHPYSILAQLTSIESLTISHFDQRVLFYLNSPSALVSRYGELQMPTPLSRLTNLQLVPAGDPPSLDNILWFLKDRAERGRALPVLRELRISGPSIWAHDLTSIDISTLARRMVLVPACDQLRLRSGGIWDEGIYRQPGIEIFSAL